MSFYEELQTCCDRFGLLTPYRGPNSNSCDNGVLFTSEALVLASRLRAAGHLEESEWNTIKTWWHSTTGACFIQPGLLARTPENQSQETVDDYYGYGAACYFAGASEEARTVVTYGRTHFGVFNNLAPGRWSREAFIWRQIPLIAHFLFAQGKKPFILLRAIWAIAVATSGITAKPGDTTPFILSWLLVVTGENRGWLCEWAAGVWKKRLFRRYPAGMIDVFSIYFGPTHPLALRMLSV